MRTFPITLLALLALATPAAAETNDLPSELVVVTATKTPAASKDVPASVTVLGGDRLAQAQRFSGAESAADLLPGVEAAVANGSQVAFQIRGVGAVDHQALTPSAAAVYVDGVYLATNVQTGFLTYDLERLEALKGPQGTLYGRNASSGALNFVTNRPGPLTPNYIEGAHGSFDRFDTAFGQSFEIAPSWRGRLAGRYLTQNAALDNVAGPKDAGGALEEWGLRGALQYDPGEGGPFFVLLRGHYEQDTGVNASPRNDALGLSDHDIAVGADGVRGSDNAFYGGSIEATSTFADWALFSLTAVEGFRQKYGFDFDGTPAPVANLAYDRTFLQFSEELRASRDFDRVKVLVGAFASADDFTQDYLIWCGDLDRPSLVGTCNYVGAPARVGPAPSSTTPAASLLTYVEQTRETAALFSYNDIALSEPLTLTIGARLTYENIEGRGYGLHIFRDGVQQLNNRSGAGPAEGANTIEETRLSGNVSLRYALADAHTVYLSYANGYKSGGFNGEIANNATHYQDEGLFQAETVDAFEIGWKARPSANLRWDAAMFYYDYNAPQARIFVNFALPGGGSITSNSLANLDEATAYGFDGQIDYAPWDGLDLGAALTLLHTEIEQSAGANAAAFDGKPLPFASNGSMTVFGRFERPVADSVRGSVDLSGKYRSHYYLDAEGRKDRRQSGFATIDASTSIYLDKYGAEFLLFGRNLTDEDYAVSGYGFIGYDTFRSAPRTWGVGLRMVR